MLNACFYSIVVGVVFGQGNPCFENDKLKMPNVGWTPPQEIIVHRHNDKTDYGPDSQPSHRYFQAFYKWWQVSPEDGSHVDLYVHTNNIKMCYHYSNIYLDLAEGEIIGILGSAYRATEVPEDASPKSRLVLQRIEKSDDLSTAIKNDSIFVTYNDRDDIQVKRPGEMVPMSANVMRSGLVIEEFLTDDDVRAQINVGPLLVDTPADKRGRSKRLIAWPEYVVDVGKGDSLPVVMNATDGKKWVRDKFEQYEFTVRNVVPSDPQQKIRGWIELDPNPVRLEE